MQSSCDAPGKVRVMCYSYTPVAVCSVSRTGVNMLGERVLWIMLQDYWLVVLVVVIVALCLEIFDYLMGGNDDG